MKSIKFTLIAASAFLSGAAFAITPQEVVDNYYENIGGKEAWGAVNSVTMWGEMKQGPMTIPLEVMQAKGGKTYTKYSVQGKDFLANVFDGETLWSTSFMTMKPEKSDSEATNNMKLNSNDFPDALYNYAEKGYTLEIVGNEEIEGTETIKMKLTKEPQTIEGKQVQDISYYYMDAEAYVPLMVESEILTGQGKGRIMQIKFSDYQEVDGKYFPFTLAQGVKGGPSAPLTFSKVVFNQEFDESILAMPVVVEEKKAAAKAESKQ